MLATKSILRRWRWEIQWVGSAEGGKSGPMTDGSTSASEGQGIVCVLSRRTRRRGRAWPPALAPARSSVTAVAPGTAPRSSARTARWSPPSPSGRSPPECLPGRQLHKHSSPFSYDTQKSLPLYHQLRVEGRGATHKRQISKPPTPYQPVSISANNHNRLSQRLG